MHISTKCSVAIHCLIFIAEYGETHKVTSELLARSAGINAVTIRNIFSALKKDGILSVKFGTGGATLACPPEEISLYRVCKAIEPDFLVKLIGIHQQPSPSCPVGQNIAGVLEKPYQKIRDDLRKSLEEISLAGILSDYRARRENASSPDTDSDPAD